MKEMKKHLNGILLCLFELAVGILLLIDPLGFTTGIVVAAGVALLILALVLVIKYCRTDAKAAAQGQYLLKGLLALAAGAAYGSGKRWHTASFREVCRRKLEDGCRIIMLGGKSERAAADEIIGGLDDFQTEPIGFFRPVFDFAAIVFFPFFLVRGINDEVDFCFCVCRVAGAHEFFRRGCFAFSGDDRFAAFFIVFSGTARAEIFVHFSVSPSNTVVI